MLNDLLKVFPGRDTRSWMKNTDEKPKIYTRDQIPGTLVRIKDPELKTIRFKLSPEGNVKPRWNSRWIISTGYEESLNIDDQIRIIYEMLKDKVGILNELREKYSLTFHLRVVPKIEDNEKPSMFFGPYIIDFVHDIKATIDIDLYIFS